MASLSIRRPGAHSCRFVTPGQNKIHFMRKRGREEKEEEEEEEEDIPAKITAACGGAVSRAK